MAQSPRAQQEFAQVLDLYKRKRWHEAEQAARRFIRQHGDRADGWAVLGASLHR